MNKEKEILPQLENGVLTQPMDIGSKEYQDFKLLIRSKVLETPKPERVKVALLGLKYEMQDYLLSNSKLVGVGSFLKNFIRLIEIKQVEFANYLEMKPSNLSKILKGERKLNIEFALILENLSNIKAELWLGIQNQNAIRKVQKTQSKRLGKYKLKELIE